MSDHPAPSEPQPPSPRASVNHPGFARLWLSLAPRMDRDPMTRQHRAQLVAGLSGRVCEVGAGTGSNFGFYPQQVSEVIAVEPEPTLRAAAAREADRVMHERPQPSIIVVEGTADVLPGDDGGFDAVVSSLVLCSVPDQHRALTEMRRVLRTGGSLRLYEHVRSDSRGWAMLQDALTPLWSRVAGGCHPNRPTTQSVQAAGFTILERQDLSAGRPVRALPHVLARAVPTPTPTSGS
jgi:ubiquinone/menaquinone biosynthesis C-methylase UbiE